VAFFQEPPGLRDTWRADVVLREHLERLLPPEVRAEVEPQLAAMGAAAAGDLARLAEEAEASPPRLVAYDAWGRRVDRIEVSPAWRALHAVQARAGLAALPYEGRHGQHARVVQHALLHLYAPSSAVYTCPVAMTDAAARVLIDHAPAALRDRVVPRLLARDPELAWTSGQWMTEREGGSDVGRTATVARPDGHGGWRLHGVKWFTSATSADCALLLARPEGAPSGSRGLGLFLVERVDPATGASQLGATILVNRLKDKLGTRALPTAELTLAGAAATPVGTVEARLKKMAGMLNVTRAHNAVAAAAGMRRGLDLAVAYARVRSAFGRPLLHLPLHRETLADLAVQAEAAFALVARVMEVQGRVEHGAAGDLERRALRALVPTAKLLTAKDAVAHASEVVEAFGGAGYVEDSGVPRLLRDAQVLPIWEGTTNVLALDLLRAELKDEAMSALLADLACLLTAARAAGGRLAGAVELAERAAERLAKDVRACTTADDTVQAGMRDLAVRLGRAYTAGLLAAHALHRLQRHGDDRAAHAACRYAERWLCAPPAAGVTQEHLAASLRLLGPAALD
jgi:alkylation response protein AidB-like acyl-CoA dehydrogenase